MTSHSSLRPFPKRVCDSKNGVRPVLFVIAVLFPSIWLFDFAFAFAGGRPVKIIAWIAVIGVAAAVAGYSAWLRQPPLRAMLVAMGLSGLLAGYVAAYQWVSPPVYDFNQAVSLCILAPFSLYIGLSLRYRSAAHGLGLLGGSVSLLFLVAVIRGTASLDSGAFQAFLPAEAGATDQNTGYQGLSLFAGFLPLFILTRWLDRRGRATLLPLCALMVSVLPVFYIGGRSAPVALCAAFTAWVFLNGLRGKRQFFTVVLLIFAALAIGTIGYRFLERAPLAIERLLRLAEAGTEDSSGRFTLWSAAIDLWLQSPQTLVVGHGPQQFPHLAGYDQPGMYPHNFILELLSEYGLLGCLLFLAAPLYLCTDGVRRCKLGFRRHPSFYFVVYYCSAMMFIGALQSIWPLFFFVGWLWSDLSVRENACASSGLVVAASTT